jgi:hypothetical protein
MNLDWILRTIGGNNIDRIGTALNLPEKGYSERANNWQPTVNTGVTPQSKAAGLDTWRQYHFEQPTGGTSQSPLPPVATSSNRPLTPLPTLPTDTGGSNELELAEQARRNRINSYRAQAGNIRSQAQNTFDNILKSVNSFRDRNSTLFSNAGQEITNNASSILGQNARTAVESAGEARARGRALGLGDSSKFNLQNKVQGNLASTQGNTIARRGEENRANRNIFDERQDQAQSQEDEANTYLRGAMDKATTIENTGYDAGEEVFANSLNDIVNYQRQLAAINPVKAGNLTQYTPNFSGITNTINGVLSGLGSGGASSGQDFGNPVNPQDIYSLLRRRGLVTG